jgi:ribosomal protein S18 acetylase RimI-like enzyme
MAEPDLDGDGSAPSAVRLPSADEWHLVRDARLAALQDAPDTLLPTQPHESSWTEGHWRHTWDSGRWAVADAAGTIVGLARLTRGQMSAHVESVWTHAEYRRRRVASALVRRLVAEERKRGRGDVFVWVIHPNPAAFGLYESLGFERTNERQTLDGLGRVEERLRLSGDLRED